MAWDLLRAFCLERGFPLSEEQVAVFESYFFALYKANESMNLTRVAPKDCESRHFIDSLLVAQWLEKGSRVLDIGSGPGLPSFPLAVARPEVEVVAMDSSNKMLDFLRKFPLDNLMIKLGRAEDPDDREDFNVVTGRALAPLSVQLELSAARARIGGFVIPFRTPAERDSFENPLFRQLGIELEQICEVALPGTEIVRVFPLYRKVAKTPMEFPRQWGRIRNSPL